MIAILCLMVMITPNAVQTGSHLHLVRKELCMPTAQVPTVFTTASKATCLSDKNIQDLFTINNRILIIFAEWQNDRAAQVIYDDVFCIVLCHVIRCDAEILNGVLNWP